MVTERTREIDGRRVRWLEGPGDPSAPVLLWLHAFPVSAEQWRPQLEAPAEGWRVIAPDLPGFGGSDDGAGPPTIDDFARAGDRLLAALGVGTAVIGGLSMGGYAALAWLRIAPTRVRALVLADTRATADSPQAREGRARLRDVLDRRGAVGIADEMLPKLLGPTTRAQRPATVDRVRRLIEANGVEGIGRAIVRLRDRPDATEWLAGTAVPVLAIVGEEDVVTPPDEAKRLVERARRGRVSVVPGAGHLSNLENPQAFHAAVTPWLASL